MITSRANPTFKQLRALLHSKGIRRAGRALIPGDKVIREFLACEPARCRFLVCEALPVEDLPGSEGVCSILLSKRLFRELDRWGCGSPLLVVDVAPILRWDQASWPHGCTVLLPLQDPRNMGAALRNVAAFGAKRVILTQEAAHPFHPDAIRASAGVLRSLELFTTGPLGEGGSLPRPLLVLDKGGMPVERVQWPPAFGLLVGIEGPGVPQELPAAQRIAIPMERGVESLNAATALAVALHMWSKSRRIETGGDP